MPKRLSPYTLTKRDNGIWYYSLYPASGSPVLEKRRSTGCTRRDRAEAFVLNRIRELIAHRDRPGSIRLVDYAADFYTDNCPHAARLGKKHSPNTIEVYRYWMDKWVLTDPLAQKALDEITVRDLVSMRQRLLNASLASSTCRNIMERVRVILKEAVINDLIPASPADHLPRLPLDGKRGRFTRDELSTLCQRGDWSIDKYAAVMIAAMLGLRQAEVLALQWKHISGDNISIVQAWKGPATLGPTKTGNKRTIPMPQKLVAICDDFRNGAGPEDLLFRSPRGEPFMKRRGRNWLSEIVRERMRSAGMPAEHETGSRSLHSLRHTLASVLIEEGVPAALVQQYMGWSSGSRFDVLTVTQAGYTDVLTEALRPVAEAIDRVFSVPG